MNLEDRLRATLARRAERVQVSSDAWARIAGRVHHPRPAPPHRLLALGALVGVLALVAVAAVFLGRGPGTTIVTTDPSTSLAPSTTLESTTTVAPASRCSGSGLPAQVANQPGLPVAVAEARRAIVAAAVACDFDELADLATAGADSFTYSFGDGGEPAEHWRQAEERGERPLWYQARLLTLPYGFLPGPGAADADIYVWPAAATGEEEDWSALSDAGLYSEQELDAMQSRGSGYLGYRLGITAGGDWIYFVAGD